MLTLLVFKKGYTKKEGKKEISYNRYFTSELDGDFKMQATLSNAFLDKVEKQGIEFPLILTMDRQKSHYFMTKESYNDKDGKKISRYKIVITDAEEIAHADNLEPVDYEEAKQFNIDQEVPF